MTERNVIFNGTIFKENEATQAILKIAADCITSLNMVSVDDRDWCLSIENNLLIMKPWNNGIINNISEINIRFCPNDLDEHYITYMMDGVQTLYRYRRVTKCPTTYLEAGIVWDDFITVWVDEVVNHINVAPLETLAEKRLKVTEAGLLHDRIYANNPDGCEKLIAPIMGKSLEDIKFLDKHKVDARRSQYVNVRGKLYDLYRIDGDKTQTMYVILEDGIIVYYTFCSIFAPASAAFHVITGVMWYGHNDQMSWVWCGLEEAECYNCGFAGHSDWRIEFKLLENIDVMLAKLYSHY